MVGPGEDEARSFAAAFRSFLEWVHSDRFDSDARNEVVALIGDYLGADGTGQSVVSRSLPAFEHVNLQTALNAWSAQPGRSVAVRGVVIPPHFGPVSLQQLVSGQGIPPLRLAAPPLVDLPNGPGSTLACLLCAVLLVQDPRGRYVVMVTGPSEHEQDLRVEVAGLAVGDAQAVLAELDTLRHTLNVYLGHLLDVSISPMGGVVLQFADLPQTAREDVVLPEAVLARVERHALGVADHRAALLAAGQHLKRGLLLYGPPGTGKTHTMRYLIGRMSGYTRLVMTGRALHAIGQAAELARDLQPAVIVLEDVDLVAEDRSFGPGSSPVLFDLLDAMDGAAPDADLLFILTTNRADLLEPALAARPGRVDVAVHIDLPDTQARGRLFDLYARNITPQLTECSNHSSKTPRPPPSPPCTSPGRWRIYSTTTRRSPAACSAWATIRRTCPLAAAWARSRRNAAAVSVGHGTAPAWHHHATDKQCHRAQPRPAKDRRAGGGCWVRLLLGGMSRWRRRGSVARLRTSPSSRRPR